MQVSFVVFSSVGKIQALLVFGVGFVWLEKPNVLKCALVLGCRPTSDCEKTSTILAPNIVK
ncbi:MAG: hypothetical protein ACOVOQ_04140, partial [Flavobacterium sp.]